MHVAVLLILRRGAMGDGIHDVLQSTTSSTLSSFFLQVGTLLQILDQWKKHYFHYVCALVF